MLTNMLWVSFVQKKLHLKTEHLLKYKRNFFYNKKDGAIISVCVGLFILLNNLKALAY